MTKRSKVHPNYKARYRVNNWPSYDRGLVRRGSLTGWFSPEAIRAWTPEKNGCRGGQRRYSNVAVQTALHLRLLLGLPWRQTEGLLKSLVELVGLDLEIPDHTTLSRRSRDLATDLFRSPSSGPIHLIVDASGLKVFGQGEWAAAKYGRRGMEWRKLHLAVDEGGRIVAAELTDNDVADASDERPAHQADRSRWPTSVATRERPTPPGSSGKHILSLQENHRLRSSGSPSNGSTK